MFNRKIFRTLYRQEEGKVVDLNLSYLSDFNALAVQDTARQLMFLARKKPLSTFQSLMSVYNLSNKEGLALMRVTESLLRIPDQFTRDLLIQEKIKQSWMNHFSFKESVYASACAVGLTIGQKIMHNMLGRSLLRQGMLWGARFMGRQFIMGESIHLAYHEARKNEKQGYAYSYDMLGEGATNSIDAQMYYDSYMRAIKCLADESSKKSLLDAPGISIKLSALHARYEFSQKERVCSELYEMLRTLVFSAKDYNIPIFIDAEEAHRLELSLDLLEKLLQEPNLNGWNGVGLAIQAYQKRCIKLIDYLENLALKTNHCLLVRLVKGAYWDTEIKNAMEMNLPYPVFTKKINTDVSYLACAKKLFKNNQAFYPCFATHNALTQSAIMHFALQSGSSYEFQKLYGMGDSIYQALLNNPDKWPSCPDRVRVYAPIGEYKHLLPYLVRRLLENGANSSFVNQMTHIDQSLNQLLQDPVEAVKKAKLRHHAYLPMPDNIFPNRKNSKGLDIQDEKTVESFMINVKNAKKIAHTAYWYKSKKKKTQQVYSPIDGSVIGTYYPINAREVHNAMTEAAAAFIEWNAKEVKFRAEILRKAADLFEAHMPDFISLLMDEAGKILEDCVSEVREAVDFLRYYANQAEIFFEPKKLPGITGESNTLFVSGRGVFFCISPWNFPLAIFTGQVSAALAAGNTVLAKPAEQTPLIAHLAIQLLHQAGVPHSALHLILGAGSFVGGEVLHHPDLAGVVFTGSTETASIINRKLANRTGAILPLIAETGGQNAMIVDSSALPEQVTKDVLASAFRSAGQRCSALRVLFLQDDVYDTMITMIKNAAAELVVDDPRKITTDIGPVIDQSALIMLQEHEKEMDEKARLIFRIPLAGGCSNGFFFSPVCYEISDLSILTKETFGPFLHVIRYKKEDKATIFKSIEKTGYGLTLAIHSRLDNEVERFAKNVRVGNIYVNRNQIGAVVEQQPFGGMGLSGTGPKAGGPNYLVRFIQEKTITINTAASGGDADLLAMDDE